MHLSIIDHRLLAIVYRLFPISAFQLSVFQRFLCLLPLFFFTVPVLGQNVLAPPPQEFFGLPPEMRTTPTNQPGYVPPITTPPQDNRPLFEWGPVTFRPHLLYRFTYGDGIPAAPGQDYKTAINELYPGIFIGLGDHWRLDYTPTLRWYSSSAFKDTFDNSVTLSGGTVYRDWTLGLSQTYSSYSEPLIETGGQTEWETFNTALGANYLMNSRLSLELGANQNFRLVNGNPSSRPLTDVRSWSTLDWLNYQVSAEFGAAIGAGFAYDDVSLGADMTSEQLQGRLTWRPGQKLFLMASGGFEDRQFLDSNQSDAINPIFGVSALYHIFEPTTLSVGASRVISPSFYAGAITEVLSVNATLRQRLFEKLYLELGGGYYSTTYKQTIFGINLSREDDSTFFNARLSMQVLKRGTIAIFYRHTENSSNSQAYNISSDQGGVELGYKF